MADEKYVFKASRFTSGNLFFPIRIEITKKHIVRIQPQWVGSHEESIALFNVASVTIKTGWIWSDIRIDSSGGSHPILSHGHHKHHARQIRDLVERFQHESKSASKG